MAIADLPKAPALPAAPPTPPAPALRRATVLDRAHRMTIERYNRMVEAGVYGPKDKVILWKGILVDKMTKHPPHATAMTKLNRAMVRLVPDGFHSRLDQPVTLNGDSLPEPDLTVVRGEIDRYRIRHPDAAEIALIVEVADSSLTIDRGEVLEEYARAGIPTYWIVNIPDRLLEVYTEPTGPCDAPTYRVKRSLGPDEAVPVVLDGQEIGRLLVGDLLP